MQRRFVLALATIILTAGPLTAQTTIADATRGLTRQDGYFPIYLDAARSRLLLEISRWNEEFLYLPSLATGIGSHPLGLDRGMIGGSRIARWVRSGNRAHLELTNPGFAAVTDNADLRRSVDESFPTSVVASLEIVGEERDRVVVDATPFFVGDQMDIIGRLRGANQGTFRLERDRSGIHEPRTRAFPENTEVEVSLTFASDNPGWEIRRHAPDGRALTIRQHHSLVKLPNGDYRPRRFDPRSGFFSVTIWDFAKGPEHDYPTRYIVRHRLEKRNPGDAPSEAVKPIVYYLDPGIPEPYRSAFREGAMWWNDVFAAAGYVNAFRVEDMPADMDPMDSRYHVIQWVHRTAPSWSIGPSFVDPRTGEIIKAAVRMDSHRSLVNYDQYAGAVPAFGMGDEGTDHWLAEFDQQVTGEEFTMARRRQHTAHEVGHTLGLAHNFISESQGRASVMDYPAPLIRLDDGRIDLSQAYRPGPGAWDSLAIRYGYTEFPPDQEDAGLEAIIREGQRRGLDFITNPDENPAGAYPEATTWVNGSDMLEELDRVMTVRRHLLERFDTRAIRPGEPMTLLATRFGIVYLHHRYTLGGALKAVGGMEFRYGVRGDTMPPTRVIPADRQRRALRMVMDALEPSELAVPERIVPLLSMRTYGYPREERSLGSPAGPAFDQLSAARSLAHDVVGGLLHPARMARVAAFSARNPAMPALDEVLGTIVERTWGVEPRGEGAALRRVVQRAVLDELTGLAADTNATVEARAAAEWTLRNLRETITRRRALTAADAAHLDLAAADITRFLERREAPTPRSRPLDSPPGSPIGW